MGVVAHPFNTSTREVEEGRSELKPVWILDSQAHADKPPQKQKNPVPAGKVVKAFNFVGSPQN